MQNRPQKLMERLPEEIDGVLIRSFPNRFYYTGFSSSAGTLLITRGKSLFIIDSRYIEAAESRVKNCEVMLETDLPAQLRAWAEGSHIKRVGTETGYLSMQEGRQLAAWLQPAELLADGRTQEAILRQRRIKSPEEIENLAEAQRITDEAFAYILDYIRPGEEELEVAIRFGAYMSRHGSERRSYDFIFTSGEKTSLPHGSTAPRVIQKGDFVMMDLGSTIGGYGSDMTRTVAVGPITDEQKKVYEIVLEAQRRALEAIRPGRCCREIDAAAREYIAACGYGEYFGHGLGHSLGVEIHENPRFNQTCTDLLEPGVVMTVEPGIYLPGRFGVRIEDMVVITETGCRNLTKSRKELICL